MASTRQLNVYLLLLCLLVSTVHGCFLNSCPYRRYGRTVQCASCGDHHAGICTSEGQCCVHNKCFETPECTSRDICPSGFCKILKHNGFCVAPTLCCTNEICQRSMQCA
ncbi:unnamed protein product, partial [Mesorhabditis spiculigera]